jgi:hypothetical protein
MRGDVRGVTPLRSIRMRERANFSAHFGAGRTVCTNNCLNRHAIYRKHNHKLRIICNVKFHACGSTPRALKLRTAHSSLVRNFSCNQTSISDINSTFNLNLNQSANVNL